MASLRENTTHILERSRVAPPPNSVTQSSLPLTFFDIFWIYQSPVKRLFFYEFTHPKTHFIHTILPKLKHSLSLSLQLFYPLAGNLTHSPESGKPLISYTDGDSVELTLAESNSDFYQFLQNNPRDVTKHHPLVPNLSASHTSETPLMALQVTIFPDFGICIGITIHHLAADGRSSTHFMKSWASICRLGDASSITRLPFYDRSVIKDPNGLETIFSNQLAKIKADNSTIELGDKTRVDSVVATFVLRRADVERLRRSVPVRCSTFVLTCAYVWVCLTKSHQSIGEGDTEEHFGFTVDSRARLDPPVPDTYFGNCLGGCFVAAKRSDLVGGEGLAIASEAIGKAIRGLENGTLRGAEGWIPKLCSLTGRMISVAGSPIFRVYETDFGWGRPSKVEVVSIESTDAISLAENRNEDEGGVEIGLIRSKHQVDVFDSLFQEGLKGEK